MAFPTVAESIGGTDSASPFNSVVITTSSMTIASTDLLVGVLATDGSNTHTWPTTGDVWTEIVEQNDSEVSLSAAYRHADGTEGDTTVSLSGNQKDAWVVYRITGHHDTAAVEGNTANSGSDTSAEFNSITPSWGSDDNLIIACVGADEHWSGSFGGTHSEPDNQRAETSSSGGGCNVFTSTDEETTSPYTPPTATTDATQEWISFALAVRPVAAGGGATPKGVLGGLVLGGPLGGPIG